MDLTPSVERLLPSALNKKKTYACPHCHRPLVESNPFRCSSCNRKFMLKEDVPLFTEKTEYWCNIKPEKMLEMIRLSQETGDWLGAAQKVIPRYAHAVIPFHRADAQFYLPISSQARVLDAGAMWGGLTLPIAQFCKEIYALDKTWETLKFLDVRAQQMGFKNVFPVVASLHQMPFEDHFFDAVILNGVLEWAGVDEDVILERDWDAKGSSSTTSQQASQRDPETLQTLALKEIHRVLKPGGAIYNAIENRSGIQYFFGHPDDHVNVRFVPFLPRKLANWITRWVRNHDYRTYIYTPSQLFRLFQKAGFEDIQLFSVHPHYGKISRMTPFSIFSHVKKYATVGYPHPIVFLMSQVWKRFPSSLARFLSPSLAVIAKKPSSTPSLQPRLIQFLEQALVISRKDASQYELILMNNRFGTETPTNYCLFHKERKKIEFFCKVGRVANDENLPLESKNLHKVEKRLQGTPLESTIPKVRYSGNSEGMVVQVTDFVKCHSKNNTFLDGLRKLNRILPEKLKPFSKPVRAVGRGLWLRQINSCVLDGVRWLADFQKLTSEEMLPLGQWMERQEKTLVQGLTLNGFDELASQVPKLLSAFEPFKHTLIPLCTQHGDFDICNLLYQEKKLFVVDFEHTQESSSPFFDLTNLLLSSFVTEWKINGKPESLSTYAQKTGWQNYFDRWLEAYSDHSSIPRSLLTHLPLLGTLEQNAKQFPSSRNPFDYPLYGKDCAEELVSWKL